MEYTINDIKHCVDQQREFFLSGQTLSIDWRLKQLKLLKAAVASYEQEFEEALQQDLGRSLRYSSLAC